MLKETYTPRKGYVLLEVTILRPKKSKSVFVDKSAQKSVLREGDVTAYKVVAKSDDSSLKVGGYVLPIADINSPGMFGNIVPEDTIISEVEYDGLDDYIIKSYAEMVEEHGKTK
jgi:hypothetical protein